MRILFFLLLTISLMGQTPPRVTFKQIQRDTLTGSVAISGADSNLIYSRDIIIANNKLVVFGDTIGQGGGLASVLVDSVTIYGNGLNTALYVDTNYIKNMIGFFTNAGLGIDVSYDSTNKILLIESLAIEDSVYNGTASTISKGTPLYAVGSQGNYWSVAPADASDIDKLPVVAIAGEEILAGATGLGLIKGHIKGVNTTGFTDGDEIYLAVSGGYTNVKPKGESNYIQRLGTVIKGNSANGSGIINLGELERNLNPQKIFIGANDSTIITVNLSDSLATKANLSHTHIISDVTGLQDSLTNKLNTNLSNINGTLQEANGGTGETTYTNGQLLIGNTSTGGLDKATLTAGSGVTITNGGGSITIASTGGGSSFNNLTETADTVFVAKYLNVDTSTLYVDADLNRVGIGTSAPSSIFQVDGTSGAPSSANSLLNVRNKDTNIGFQMGANSTYGWIRAVDVNVAVNNIHLALQPTGINNYVAIGTNSPTSKLYIKSSGTTSSTSALNVADFDNNSLLYVGDDGKVGIGTTTPTEKLDVDGNLKGLSFISYADSSDHVGSGSFQAMDFNLEPPQASTGNLLARFRVFTNFASSRGLLAFQKFRGSLASPQGVLNNDVIGGIAFAPALTTGNAGTATALVEAYADADATSTEAAARLSFVTGSTGANRAERLTVKSDGKIGMGTTTPTDELHNYRASGTVFTRTESASIANGETAGFSAEANSRLATIGVTRNSGSTNAAGFIYLNARDNDEAYIWIDSSGSGATASILRISNDITAIGNNTAKEVGTQSSDKRLKTDLGNFPYGLNEVMQLTPVQFAYKEDYTMKRNIGFYAQDVLPIIPEAVFDTKQEIIEGEPTMLYMQYVFLVPVLTKAIQEQQAIIESQKAEIEQLKTQYNNLLQRIIQLENK